MKAMRNEICPCGSGKKYKKCCINTSNQTEYFAASRQSIGSALNLAKAYISQGDMFAAGKIATELLNLYPKNEHALYLCGIVAYYLGQYEAAANLFTRAISVNPKPDYYNDLSNAYVRLGRIVLAILAIKEAINLDPTRADFYYTLSAHTIAAWDYVGAEVPLRHAITLAPEEITYQVTLGMCLYHSYQYEELDQFLEQFHTKYPNSMYRIPMMTLAEYIIKEPENILKTRKKLLANIEQIKHENLDLKLVNQHLLKIVDIPHFGMAYHGIDDKELFIKLYQMYSNLIPSLNFVAKHITNYQKPSNRKIKIGFLSHYFFDHSIGRSFNKIIEGLAESEQFEVIVFTVKKVNDDYINSLKSKMTYVELPVSHIDSFRTIESYELDVLTYADIGMNSETYCLACTRLAPIQCCLFGHPNTTGIATIDYFISSKIMEPEHAQKYYSEKLLLLNSIPAIITKPTVIPDQLTRKDLNLPEDATIYICPMTLYKVHPDFEQMVGKILQQDPKGIIIFFEDYQFKLAGQIVYKRLMQALPDMSNRILFFPWLKAPRFINLLILADAILDTPHFGAGTTGYMAFAFGLPIVTWPGEFLRGRVMLSCYNIMGINDLIAKDQDHYVTLAVRLANDLEFRNMIKEKILQNNHHLYDQHREPVAEMSQLFVELIENYK